MMTPLHWETFHRYFSSHKNHHWQEVLPAARCLKQPRSRAFSDTQQGTATWSPSIICVPVGSLLAGKELRADPSYLHTRRCSHHFFPCPLQGKNIDKYCIFCAAHPENTTWYCGLRCPSKAGWGMETPSPSTKEKHIPPLCLHTAQGIPIALSVPTHLWANHVL